MSNFGFLADKQEFTLFSAACIEAEKIYATAPAMCAVGCRKALELAVKWVYAADTTMQMPYKDNLQALIHEPSFMHALEYDTWSKLRFIIKLGNRAVHTEQRITGSEAVVSLKVLFEFVDWIDYCYGNDYENHQFDEALIPTEAVSVDTKKIKAQESLLGEKDAEIEALRAQLAELSAQFTAAKEAHTETRTFSGQAYDESETRKLFIDEDLKEMGWIMEGVDADVQIEYPVDDMDGVPGQKGRVDYVLFGKDGVPLALIEAKRAGRSIGDGKKQAVLYADALERRFGRRPMIFLSNGYQHYVWDDTQVPERRVFNFFSKDDLQKLMNRRHERKALTKIPIDDKITDRYYQKAAIRAVCEQIELGIRKHLLVMATGTGKTRTASSLADVLSRGKWVTNILFLADRKALVKQAKDDFKNYLPEMSLCNLCENKDDRNARIVFSTYPTILNVIDDTKSKDGRTLFTPAHFDLIIIDESHRSIFKKYRAIFDYFDAMLVGLTATPKTEVDRNTYDFFNMADDVPTYVYDYETAVNEDKVLVPYYNYEVKTKFLEEGITYDELSDEDKRRYEDAFAEDEEMPEFIPSNALNKFVFNQSTVDMVLQDVMERGIHVAGGDRLGKTIIFAQNKRHADYIVERFNVLYPQYKGKFAQRVVCDDDYAQNIIDDFKQPDKEPHIAVSVDMMDTGIDVPQVVNLVFFKKVRSKTKFWQMIGRGTRLCKGLECLDEIDGAYTDKRRFIIFDYCGNFEFFREHKEGFESHAVKTLTENIFSKRVRLMMALQEPAFNGEDYQAWRKALVDTCQGQVASLSPELIAVKTRREYVERYKEKAAYDILSEGNKAELLKEMAPIVYMDDKDEYAKRFDNFMYGMMLAHIEQMPAFKRARGELCKTAALLEKKQRIKMVNDKLDIIKQVQTDAFWDAGDVLQFEKVRVALRELIQFINDGGREKPIVFIDVDDLVTSSEEGNVLDVTYDFEDYRAKVNRYVNEHGDTMAIHKLTHNIPLARGDYEELERVLTSELGSKEDYEREYGDTPFGLLIRKIAKLDHDAAMAAFSEFINDQTLNQRQIDFVHKIITHIEINGYMESPKVLMKPPFDKPIPFMKLFDQKTRTALVTTINQVYNNAAQEPAM